MSGTTPLQVRALIEAYHQKRRELFAEAMQLPGEAVLVSVFFEAEGYIVEAFINRTDAFGVQLVATPMEEVEGPAVSYTITDFDDPLPVNRPLTWN